MKNRPISDKLKIAFLILYFVILTIERIISLISVFTGDFSGYDALDRYMTILTVFSIIGTYIFILSRCCKDSSGSCNGIFGKLAIAAGILLLGGMVHTEGTIPPIQFASYGMLLISMAIHTIQSVKENGNALQKWLSYSYIVALSMSIPVVYHADVSLAWLFIPLEVVVSAGLVALFTYLLRRHYIGDGSHSFSAAPLAVALIGDAAVIVLRWEETINWFVLIFIAVATVLWIVGKIVTLHQKKG